LLPRLPLRPQSRRGPDKACPFTTLYWDFSTAIESRFGANMRMKMQLSNLRRKDDETLRAIARRADRLRETLG
jgi:deoxyribodipyrimidine photolyase-related protein